MSQINKKKVLLIEPNYGNKFPPVGLMKIASYYRNLGNWDVLFYKGDLNDFVVERITNKLVKELNDFDDQEDVDWTYYQHQLFSYIKTRKMDWETIPIKSSPFELQLSKFITDAKDSFWKKTWEKEWDRVGVTTLFTFYWKQTVETIEFAKKYLVKDDKCLMVGGVLASIQPNELSEATGLPIHQHGEPGGIHIGTLKPGDLDIDDNQPIDELELDYSILDEIEYRYDMSNAYYRYTTRGCVNKCAFCAVPTLEPDYIDYIPLKKRIEIINELYGEQKDLLLMDNNVLASDNYEQIINEIVESGFGKGAKFIPPNQYEIATRNLRNGINDRAYIRKSWSLITDLYEKLNGDDSFELYKIRDKYHIVELITSTKENLLLAYEEIKDIYEKHRHKSKGIMRYVDFNQGMDARLFTPEKAELLSRIAIRPVRIAFDDIRTTEKYCAAIKMCAEVGIKEFSNYLLYNFKDQPIDLYKRMRINVDLCEELSEKHGHSVNIYSFPMKFHPIRKTNDMDQDYSHNRDYIGIHWNRKFIRAVQAILNSTKGKIGKGVSFFNKAFGENEKEFEKIIRMPETMLIYRFFFEWMGTDQAKERANELLGSDVICEFSVSNWWNCYQECESSLPTDQWEELQNKIFTNEFNSDMDVFTDSLEKKLLSFYTSFRKDIITPNSDMYIMRQEYEKNPIYASKYNKKMNS